MAEFIPGAIDPEPLSSKSRDLFLGTVSGRECVYKLFGCVDGCNAFVALLESVKSSQYLPNYMPPFQIKHPAGSVALCYLAKPVTISSYFRTLKTSFRGKSWMTFIHDKYRLIFSSLARGLMDLFEDGLTVKNLRRTCFVVQEGRVIFLDIVPLGDDRNATANNAILELVDYMKFVAGFGRREWDDHRNEMPSDILTFLTNVDEEFLKFIDDPLFVLFDPWIYVPEEKAHRSTQIFMFMNGHRNDLKPYFEKYPPDWQTWVESESFLDTMVTESQKTVAGQQNNLKEKEFLLDSVRDIKSELKTGSSKSGAGMKSSIHKAMEICDRRFVGKKVQRGVLEFAATDGFRYVPQMGRNTTHHYNQHAKLTKQPLETLDVILSKVNDAFNYTCSHMQWFCINVWCAGRVLDWKKHKRILCGKEAWDYQQ